MTLNFSLSVTIDTWFQYDPIDGGLPLTLGVAYDGGNLVIDALKNQLDAPIFSVWLDK